MNNDLSISDLDAAAKVAADTAAAARSAADRAKDAASAAAEVEKLAHEKAMDDPSDDAARAASESAAADAFTKTAAAKVADDQARVAEAAANDAAAKTAAAKAAPPDPASTIPTQGTLVAQPIAQIGYFDLLRTVVIDPNLTGPEKEALLAALKGMSPTSDRWTFRWAIWILGLLAVLTVVAIWMIALNKELEIPAGLVAIGSGAAGALAGLLNNKGSEP